jgi:hypothetical protein
LRWSVLNEAQLARLYQPPYGDRAVVLKSSQELIGACGFVPSFGPFGQLPHHLERRHSLASLDPGDVRSAATGEREIALAQPCGLPCCVESLANISGVVVVGGSSALERHVYIQH